ncbi:MAG: ATP-grasp domain-containing protein [Ectothiorhodospiraceae bacterium]|nr:ATP-grasp domain-containing protein [Ectothiorhodospiraceae bacterium]
MLDRGKVLIANRGEIACRIIRACRSLGLRTVAVNSEADTDSLHVEQADESVVIGPAPARESYLVPERILAAAESTGAGLIHPGYGFLAEDGAFAQAVIDAGRIWVGPSPRSIDEMGDKDRARAIAREAGVPVVPGSARFGADSDADSIRLAGDSVGYPLLVKAAAGGGGIGMQRVDNPDSLEKVVRATQSMASKAFGDAGVYLERFVPDARHIEVQIFGFGDAGGVHLYDRDCSVQRRFQKIIEEAPAPGLPDKVREDLYRFALALVSHQRYEGAGTVEFIYDIHREEAYFLEMNTRIQVEHPVTEMLTGIDLVKWQLQYARGELKPVSQQSIVPSGHAVECRLYAERPEKRFLPSPGQLKAIRWPSTDNTLRVDAGVREGDQITPFYDPLIAKLVAWGVDRSNALARMRDSLAELSVDGVHTNANFLDKAIRDSEFCKGGVSTRFVDDLMMRGTEHAAIVGGS